jgi:hypothetical protein
MALPDVLHVFCHTSRRGQYITIHQSSSQDWLCEVCAVMTLPVQGRFILASIHAMATSEQSKRVFALALLKQGDLIQGL